MTRRVRTWLEVLDRDERPHHAFESIVAGGITSDVGQRPRETAEITVLSPPRGRLNTQVAYRARRFVRLHWEELTPSGWLRFARFTGPITSFRRQGAQLTFYASSKEYESLDPYLNWTSKTYHPRELVVDVIHDILASRGERLFDLPERSERLGRELAVHRFGESWPVVQRLARQIGRRAEFDGFGHVTLRARTPRHVEFSFTGRHVLSTPEVSKDFVPMRNVAVARGPDPRGFEYTLQSSVALESSNTLSPGKMARNGVPRRAIALEDVSFPDKDRLGAKLRLDLVTDDVAIAVSSLDDFNDDGGKVVVGELVFEYNDVSEEGAFPTLILTEPVGADVDVSAGEWVSPYDTAVFYRREELRERAKEFIVSIATSVGFDSIPVPHARLGMLARLADTWEGQSIDERFVIRSMFYPATVVEPMTIGTWRRMRISYAPQHRRRTWVPGPPRGSR